MPPFDSYPDERFVTFAGCSLDECASRGFPLGGQDHRMGIRPAAVRAAMREAVASGRPLFIPSGTYVEIA